MTITNQEKAHLRGEREFATNVKDDTPISECWALFLSLNQGYSNM